MENGKALFLNAEEVAQILNVSVPTSYKIIQKMNRELKAKNYFTCAGRINRSFLESKIYGGFDGLQR